MCRESDREREKREREREREVKRSPGLTMTNQAANVPKKQSLLFGSVRFSSNW